MWIWGRHRHSGYSGDLTKCSQTTASEKLEAETQYIKLSPQCAWLIKYVRAIKTERCGAVAIEAEAGEGAGHDGRNQQMVAEVKQGLTQCK